MSDDNLKLIDDSRRHILISWLFDEIQSWNKEIHEVDKLGSKRNKKGEAQVSLFPYEDSAPILDPYWTQPRPSQTLMSFSEECLRYCRAPEEGRIENLGKLVAWPDRFQAPSDELAHYNFALLFQQLSQLSDSLDQAGMETFLRIHSFLKSLTDISQVYLECFRCLQLAKLIARAEKFKMGKDEDLNAKIEGGRIAALLEGMRKIHTLKKFLIEAIAVGREPMGAAPRAIIGNYLKKSADNYSFVDFSDGTLVI